MAIVKGTTDVGVASDQTLGYGTTTAVIVREVGTEIFHLDPSASPFTLLTSAAGTSGTDNPKFEWYEKALRPKATQINEAGGYTSGRDTMTVDDATVFKIRDLVLVPRTDDKMVVTAINAPVVTFERDAAGATGAALVDGDDLLVIGSAMHEGADVGIPDEWQESHVWNLTQIFRSPFGASRTRTKTKTYHGDTKAKLGADTGIMHAIDLERAYLFSGREEWGSGPDTLVRTTGGFMHFDTNMVVLDMSDVPLSEPDLEGWFEDLFEHTAASDSRTLFAAPAVISAFDQLPMEKIRISPSDKTYGLAINQYKTSHGVLNIVKHRLLVDGAGGNGFGSWALAVDVSRLKNRVLDSTKLLTNRQSNGRDGWISEYLTESGLELRNPEVHGILKNVGSYV